MSSENKTLTPIWIVYADGARLPCKYDGAIKLLWFVNSKWDFESYESGKDYVTELPVDKKKNLILQIPDGLSNYLTKVNKAQEFYYGTDWEETVCIEK